MPLALKYITIYLTTLMQLCGALLQLDESADLAGLTQPAQSISEHHNTQSVETTVNNFFYFIKNATYQFPSEH